jgi:N-acyl-D-aspartate/D-glutamate deacylase
MFEDLPAWSRVFNLPTREEKLAAFRDPAVRDQLQYEGVDGTMQCFFARDWENVTLVEVATEKNKQHVGKSIKALAAEQNKRIIDTLLDLTIEENFEARFLYPAANFGDDAAVATMLRSPLTIMGSSDAGAHVKTLCGAGDTSLLLSRWVRDNDAIPLEEAVKRITHDQAAAIGLRNRGLLRPGYAADIVVFRPDDVEYLAPRWVNDLPKGAARLWRDAPGIDFVLVNGGVAVADGKLLEDALHGEVLGGDALLY